MQEEAQKDTKTNHPKVRSVLEHYAHSYRACANRLSERILLTDRKQRFAFGIYLQAPSHCMAHQKF